MGWRGSDRASVRYQGKMIGIKKPAFAGFFNKVQQAGD
ncbi:TPA: hypothetical protein MFC63_003038 [Klebsiella pneumoniae]|nr:hypothetical protein [Klebsiella pneumoniae]